ncbi:sensor histidine kinase [Nocardioides sp. zg-579]|uniref:Sensor histidine kinase n=1 Tax=Nocardioides marmotae TaxID=2663857 RepID=A0A6I3JFR5_9ACTN|nr:sensor histidine kinase [Nocardioides marmotae]MCR6033302.1 sensor histidine kinase [Gordonia jinghuaiqii]MTB96959.1 sensor histidine kinase [Nocardioides marmotae]QKE00659.1 sensor histidine kinase [Nocardioides marmotae]
MSSATAEAQAGQQWLRHLPLVLLGVSLVVALVTGPATGATSSGPRLAAQLGLAAATAALLAWWAYGPTAGGGPARFALRTALAFALTALNPLFCVFAWIGFADAADVLRGRWVWVGFAATAAAMATGQSGGLPTGPTGHLAFFLALFALNFGLAAAMGRAALQIERTSTDRAAAIAELERLNASLEEALLRNEALQQTVVAQARVAGVQEERQRLAREIHDTIAQSLAGVLTQLQAAGQEADPDARIRRATELARSALAEARRSVLDLAPAPLHGAGLPEAIDAVVRCWAADQDPDRAARTDLVVTGEVRPLHPEVEATVLRIVQESLANVAKHARAGRVGVTLDYDGEEVVVDVRDDGVGFDAGRPAPPSSFGLRGMHQRAARLAGTLTLESCPGGGTAVSLRLPALAREAA